MVNKKILFLAIIFALVTSALVLAYLTGVKKPKAEPESANVVVAVKTIEKNSVITASDVKGVKVAKSYANPKAIVNTADVIGKRVQERILEGEQVLTERIAGKEKLVLAYNIPEGKRAVAINVTEVIEAGDFIRPGDYVDILATFEKYEVEESSVKITYPKSTRIILQDVLILGIGQSMDVPEKPRANLPKTVTLAVTPEEAEKLVFGEESGALRMALRSTGDHKKANTQGIIMEDLAGEKGKKILSK